MLLGCRVGVGLVDGEGLVVGALGVSRICGYAWLRWTECECGQCEIGAAAVSGEVCECRLSITSRSTRSSGIILQIACCRGSKHLGKS